MSDTQVASLALSRFCATIVGNWRILPKGSPPFVVSRRNALTAHIHKRGIVARTLEETPQLRVAYALHKARQYRHHRQCQCGLYDGEACNAEDAMWRKVMDRELGNI